MNLRGLGEDCRERRAMFTAFSSRGFPDSNILGGEQAQGLRVSEELCLTPGLSSSPQGNDAEEGEPNNP